MGAHRSHDGGCGKEDGSEKRIQKGVVYLYIAIRVIRIEGKMIVDRKSLWVDFNETTSM
jgi:hypothetical protein